MFAFAVVVGISHAIAQDDIGISHSDTQEAQYKISQSSHIVGKLIIILPSSSVINHSVSVSLPL
jgi:hypothetical protein